MQALCRVLACLRDFRAAAVLLLLAAGPVFSADALPPEVTRGLAWLSGRMQPDGSLAGESTSLATVLQARTEASFTFSQLGTASAGLLDGLPVASEEATEDLARRVTALTLAGRNVMPLLSALLARQNGDGGFPGPLGYDSAALDTAWALIALSRAGASGPAVASARGHLLRAIGADGGLPGGSDAQRIHLSALALISLQLVAADLPAADGVRRVSAWLLQRQGLDGSWQGDAYLSAIALAALAPVLADASVRNRARLYLAGLQAADGSWNEDPFVTAVALRALVLEPVEQPVLPATLAGRVVDQATGNALAGAVVTLSGAAAATASSDAGGRFGVGELKPGTYALRIGRSGYGAVTAQVVLNAGQTLDVGNVVLVPLPTGAIVRGKVSAAAGGLPLAGAHVTVQGGTSLSALTGVDGSFELSDVAPGNITLAASLAGYQSAAGTASVAAGQVVLFSPTLVGESEPPPTQGRFIGQVAALGTQAPLAGVSVSAGGGNVASTRTDGSFEVTLAPGEYTVTYALAGFESAQQHFVLSAGTELNGGVVLLPVQRSATLLRGVITDRATGMPVPGARIEVRGGGPVATAGADGAYLLDGLSGETFDLTVGAAGYLTQLATLRIPSPSEVVHDFALQRQNAPGMSLAALDAVPAAAPSRTLVVAHATVANTGTANGTAILRLEVSDATGALVAQSAAYAPSGSDPIGVFTLPPGESIQAELRWNTAQFEPGTYTLFARLVEPGSITATNPAGRVIAELADTVVVLEDLHFRATITADPPLLRAGTSTNVTLSAMVQNDGNSALPSRSYELRVVRSETGTVVYAQRETGATLAPNALQPLAFPDWLPAEGGNYRVELQAGDPQLGKADTAVYVGDSARAAFILSQSVAAPGTPTVRAQVRVEGQDVTSGTISDPLAPLVRDAIRKAVSYADDFAFAHSVNDLRCYACHVQTQALVGGELNRRLAPANEQARRTLLNFLTTTQNADGSSGHDGFKASSMLTLWALNAWQRKEQVVSTQLDVARYLRARQDGDGGWTSDHGFAWWRTRVSLTGINVKSFIELRRQLAQTTAAPVQLRPATWAPGSALSDTYLALAADGNGALYATGYYSGQLIRRNPDGTRETLASGLSGPQGIAVAPDGTVYVATDGGIYRRLPDGSPTTRWSPQRATGVALTSEGVLYAASYSDNAIYLIDPSGVASLWLQGGALRNPYGIAAVGEDLFVTSYVGAKVLRLAPDKTLQEVVPWTRGSPRHLIRANGAWWLTTEEGFYVYDDDWVGERLDTNRGFGVTRLPDGRILYTANATVTTLDAVPADVGVEIAALDASISRGAAWLLVDGNVDAGNNLDMAQRLIGLGSARSFYDGTPRAGELQAKMEQVAATLRARQRSDGGWAWTTQSTSDSLVTAQVGVALDYLNPSPSSPEVRKAVELLLSRQRPDGTWLSENGVSSPVLISSTWVEIWLPVMLNRLGGIDTDLTLAFADNVTLANPTLAPLAVADNAGAGKTYKWKLPGVTSGGRDLEFDLTFANLALRESRPAARDAFLTFNNTFTNQPLDAPIAIPALLGSAFLELTVATDRLSYAARSAVDVSAIVHNSAQLPSAGSVQLQIVAANGVPITDLGRVAFADIAAGAQRTLGAAWNTGSSYAGPYYVLGTLYDLQNQQVATARADFQVIGVGDPGSPSAAASILADRQRYAPNDTVHLRDRLSNLSLNTSLEDLRVVTTIVNPDASVRWTRSETLAQLLPEALKDYEYGLALAGAPSGRYGARLSLQSAAGVELATAMASFDVASTADAGQGLTGRITATPRQLPAGDAVILDYEVANSGNADLAAVPVSVAIVDPAANRIVATFQEMQALPQSQSTRLARTWPATGTPGTTFVAVLYATVNGNQLTLAQAAFTLVQASVRLDVQHGLASEARVLALVSCASSKDGKEDKQCVSYRAGVLERELAVLGLDHRVVSDTQSFTEALRCGRYNTYWISGGAGKLSELVVEELRAAVRRGESLLVDGARDERSRLLDDALGVRSSGKLSSDKSQTVDFDGTVLPAARVPAVGPTQRLTLSGGTVEGKFGQGGSAALVRNAYGSGKGMVAAFDLVASLDGPAAAAWRLLLDAAFGHLASAPAPVVVENALLPLRTDVANGGAALEVEVDDKLPEGARILQSRPQAQAVEAAARWRFTLAAGASQQLRLDVRAPAAAGNDAFPAQVGYVTGTTVAPYASYPLDIQVLSADQVVAAAIDAVDHLQPGSKWEADKLAQARKAVRDARGAAQRLDYESAIGASVEALEALGLLSSVDIRPAQAALDRMLQALELRWCRSGCNAYEVIGATAKARFELALRSASLRSELGIFALDASDGQVAGKRPGDKGYAKAALENATTLFRADANAGAKADVQLTAGVFYGFYLIQGDSRASFLNRNPDNRSDGRPLAFFWEPKANPDGFEHLRATTLADGRLRLQWEDLTGGGDQDFDDLVVDTRAMKRCERP